MVLDANVLHPPGLRDLLIRLAADGQFRARWTDLILDEMTGSILRRRPDLRAEQLARTRELMCEAIPDCLVTGFENLVEDLVLPDPDDRHVLAAAILIGAPVIVTHNLRDFPMAALESLGVVAVHPDEFVLGLIEESPERVARVLKKQAGALRSPPRTPRGLVELLAETLPRSMAAIQEQTPV